MSVFLSASIVSGAGSAQGMNGYVPSKGRSIPSCLVAFAFAAFTFALADQALNMRRRARDLTTSSVRSARSVRLIDLHQTQILGDHQYHPVTVTTLGLVNMSRGHVNKPLKEHDGLHGPGKSKISSKKPFLPVPSDTSGASVAWEQADKGLLEEQKSLE